MSILILIPKPSGGGGVIILVIIGIIGYMIYSIFKTAIGFISAFWVCTVFIAAIIIACIIMLAAFSKSGPRIFFTLLISIGLIIGVIVARPEFVNGHIASDFLSVKYENALYEAGVKYFTEGNYVEAITKFTKAINHYEIRQEEHSKYAGEVFNSALAGNTSWNTFNIKNAVIISSDHSNSYLMRGRAYYKINDYAAAISDYETLESLIPEIPAEHAPRIYVHLGDAYGEMKGYNKAVWNYNKYLDLKNPNEPINYTVDKSYPADMWFCAVLWKKYILTNEQKYERWVQEICNKNPVTRAEIEAFYKKNRGSL
ncbi:MAG: tetratricopeptide repeat protein [Treponema sp.]|nr:tetratricopeptide repeat protein [Treponema sp.]